MTTSGHSTNEFRSMTTVCSVKGRALVIAPLSRHCHPGPGAAARFEKCYGHSCGSEVGSESEPPASPGAQLLQHFLLQLKQIHETKYYLKSQRKHSLVKYNVIYTAKSGMAIAICGHSVPRSAMAMAIVAIPVAPPLLPPQRRSGIWRAPSSVAHTCLIPSQP